MDDGNDVQDGGRTATPSIAEDIALLIDSIGTTRHENVDDLDRMEAAGERLRAWLAAWPALSDAAPSNEMTSFDRIESTLGPGWDQLVPHLRGSEARAVNFELVQSQKENQELRAVLAALVLDHGVDGRLGVSERAMIQTVRGKAQADVLVQEHPARWTVEVRR